MLRERERCKFLWEKEKIEPKRIYMKISFGCPSMSNTGGEGKGFVSNSSLSFVTIFLKKLVWIMLDAKARKSDVEKFYEVFIAFLHSVKSET